MIDEAAVQELLDKQAITEVIYRYCRAMDRLDLELFLSVYHPEARDDHGARKGTGHEFAAGAVVGLGLIDQRTQHHITNILIEIDGDIAWAESYLIAYHRFLEDPQSLLEFGARYVDRMERRSGEWRIAHRTIVYDWSRVSPVPEEYPGKHLISSSRERPAGPESFVHGRRDRSDEAYRRTSS